MVINMRYIESSDYLSPRVLYCRCKIGEPGTSLGQFNSPHGFCLGMNEDIVVADTLNHRIQVFDKHGKFQSVFGSPGISQQRCVWFVFVWSQKGCRVVPLNNQLLTYYFITRQVPSFWPHLSYDLVRSKREYCENCSLVLAVLCSVL